MICLDNRKCNGFFMFRLCERCCIVFSDILLHSLFFFFCSVQVKAFIRAIHEGGIRLNEPKVRKTLPLPGELP